MSQPIKKAVIPAAGWGTRFLPVTKGVPKELLPIVDKPTIEYIIAELAGAGVEEFILVISKGKESIAQYFGEHPELEKELKEKGKDDLLKSFRQTLSYGQVKNVYQEKPLGLGHAVWCAREAVGDEPFLVALGDDLVDANPSCASQMIQRFNQFQKSMVAVQEVEPSEVHKYGVVEPLYDESPGNLDKRFLDADKRLYPLKDLVEKPSAKEAPSNLAIIGRYLLTPDIFPILEKTGQGSGGEIQLTDGLRQLNQHSGLLAYRFQGRRFDAGDKLGYLLANVHYGLGDKALGKNLREALSREIH